MVSVVIPCYRVRKQILDVIAGIGPECDRIYAVDDACPDGSGEFVRTECRDPRVTVLRNDSNRGVGGATIHGYRQALADGADFVVKLDGDGQMNPAMIPRLLEPLRRGEADYTKGNRFHDIRGLRSMPGIRLVGNAALSFMSKWSTGYWGIFDPTNGYTAIHAKVLAALPLERISERWFFESDMLFRLGLLRAVVLDVPMPAHYAGESSGLNEWRILPEFAWKHFRNTVKRIVLSYYLRDFSVASVQLATGPLLLTGGAWMGVTEWIRGDRTGKFASSGTVMLAALPILLGIQLLLAFVGLDIQNSPTRPIHPRL